LHPGAVAVGWTTSFRLGDAAYSVMNVRHSLSAIHDAAESAGLRLSAGAENHFGLPERRILEAAGKGSQWDALSKIPAIWGARWQKL
jgi:hypothetical protein